MRSLTAILAFIVLASCSVKKAEVKKDPPKLKEKVYSFNFSSLGSLNIDDGLFEKVSAFFWPSGLSEDELASVVQEVSGRSRSIDERFSKVLALKTGEAQYKKIFSSLECHQYAQPVLLEEEPEESKGEVKLLEEETIVQGPKVQKEEETEQKEEVVVKEGSEEDASDEEVLAKSDSQEEVFKGWNDKWSDINVISDEQLIPFIKCLEAQKLGKDAEADFAQKAPQILKEAVDLGKEIFGLITEKNEKPEQWIHFAKTGHKVQWKVKKGEDSEVDIFIKEMNGVDYSTSPEKGQGSIIDAQYDTEKQILSFKVIEIAEEEKTGGIYVFNLDRGKYLQNDNWTRFSGTVGYVVDGNVKKVGSAKIDGFTEAVEN